MKSKSNSDGHQFHQYQQNEQSITSHLILTELTEHKTKTTTYDVDNSGSGLGQTQTYGGVKPVNLLPSDN